MNALAEAPVRDGPAPAGDNMPPAEFSPFDAIKANMDDYLAEALNWADGDPATTQAQVDKANQLISDLTAAAAAAEAQRVEEKAPLDKKIAEIQERYNFYIADRKNKKPGKIWTAIDALKAFMTPFLVAEKQRLQAIADAAAKEAEEKAAAAAAALRQADPANLAARNDAEALLSEAVVATRQAVSAAAAKPQARGGGRTISLKTTYTARVDDPRALLLHYWGSGEHPPSSRDSLIECLRQLAQTDVDRKIHTIPGVFVVEGEKL